MSATAPLTIRSAGLALPADPRPSRRGAITPGLLLCLAIAVAAVALQRLEVVLFGRAWLETLVLAILLGAGVRAAWRPTPRFRAGIALCAKLLLEIAVVLLGVTVSAEMLLGAGVALLAGIAAIVVAALGVSYGLGRLFGLSPRMATLIACGNCICGNSAIAAVAPVIGAECDDVAASIAFTAILSVAVVLGLPVLAMLLDLKPLGFGVLAGLTVYAVPQVLAATASSSLAAAQMGTLVKLARVLMLGPVVLGLSLAMWAARRASGAIAAPTPPPVNLLRFAPWFVIGFIGLMAARSAGIIPMAAIAPTAEVAMYLAVVAMAAMGLGVDVRAIAGAGPRVAAVVTLSLLALAGMALALVFALGLA